MSVPLFTGVVALSHDGVRYVGNQEMLTNHVKYPLVYCFVFPDGDFALSQAA